MVTAIAVQCWQFVQLKIYYFASDAGYDNLTVYDGSDESAPVISQLSGNYTISSKSARTYQTTQQYMFVKFTSDDVQSGLNGFNGTYQRVSKWTASFVAFVGISINVEYRQKFRTWSEFNKMVMIQFHFSFIFTMHGGEGSIVSPDFRFYNRKPVSDADEM